MEQNKNDNELITFEGEKEASVFFDWLVKHPSAIFSIFSALVVALSFVFRALIYKNECAYLEYWHLESRLIEINGSNQIYEIVGMVIVFLVTAITQYCVINAFERYYTETEICVCGNILYKNMGKAIGKSKKDLHKLSKRVDVLNTEELCLTEKDQNLLKELTNRRESLKRSLENVDKTLKKMYRNKLLKILFWAVLGFVMAFGVFFSLCAVEISFFELLISTGIMALLFIFFSGVSVWICTRHSQKRKIKKIGYENQEIEYRQYINKFKEENSNRKKKAKEWNICFTDKMLARRITGAIFILVAILISINVVENERRESVNSFDITYVEDRVYVILYRDNTYLYMEEAEIVDNSIIIYVDKQRRKNVEDMNSSKHTFENVFRLDNHGSAVE